MKKTLLALTLGAACIMYAGNEKARASETERQFEGRISVTAPACNNNPWVRFKEDRYNETCSKDYEFTHLMEGAEKLVKWYYDDDGIWPLQMETWLDRDGNGTIDEWNMYQIDINSSTYTRLIATRAPPSAEDQQNYENALGNIGNDEVKAKWEEWKNQGGN